MTPTMARPHGLIGRQQADSDLWDAHWTCTGSHSQLARLSQKSVALLETTGGAGRDARGWGMNVMSAMLLLLMDGS